MTAPNNKPLQKHILQRFKDYNRRHHGWNNLHLVLGNLNVHDGHVAFCKQQCKQNMDFEGNELCIHLAGLSKSQRIKLARSIV